MKYHFTKQNIFSFLTILALISNIAISGISNDSSVSNIIKIISSALLLLIFFIHLRISDITLYSVSEAAPNRANSKSKISVISNPILSVSREVYRVRNLFLFDIMKMSPLMKILQVITIITLYLAITLIYSTNPAYGARKILNILISDVPNIIVLFYLITNRQKELYAKHLIFIIAIGFIITLAGILIFQPFNHSTIYQFEPQRWSHVFIGRMISFLTLIVFIYLLNQKESKKIIIYSFVFTAGLYITYLTGLRSALIGLALCVIVLLIGNIYKKNILTVHLYNIILVLILTSMLIYISPQEFKTSKRISSLVKIEDLDFGNDAAILSRVESYKISWQMFTERPLIGYGFGSFNGYNNIEWTTIQKYPHNIILEILSETGIIGFVLFLILCYSIVKKILNIQSSSTCLPVGKVQYPVSSIQHPVSSIQHPVSSIPTHFLLLAFFFSLFLAMFSKDLSTQNLLWLFLVVLSGDLNNKSANNLTKLK